MPSENSTDNPTSPEEKTGLMQPFLNSLENYTHSRYRLIKLELVDKTTTVTSDLTSGLILWTLLFMFIVFANLALALYLGHLFGSISGGFLTVSGFYLVLALSYYLLFRNWLKTKIANHFISKLLN